MEFLLKDKTVKTVVVLIAMEAEAKPFIEKLALEECAIEGPCRAYRGLVGALDVAAVRFGTDVRHGVCNVSLYITFVSFTRV